MTEANSAVQRLDRAAALAILLPVSKSTWQPWLAPANGLAIDSSIRALKDRKRNPRLRSPEELAKHSNVKCPYLFVRRFIATAAEGGRFECEIRKYARWTLSVQLAADIEASTKLRDHLRNFLERSSQPRQAIVWPGQIIDRYKLHDTDDSAAKDERLRELMLGFFRNIKPRSNDPLALDGIPHLSFMSGARVGPGSCEKEQISGEIDFCFKLIEAAGHALDRLATLASAEKARVAPANADGDVWKAAFVTTLCHCWWTLTGSQPNTGLLCQTFMDDAYTSLGGEHHAWENQIKGALARNKAQTPNKRFDREILKAELVPT